MNRRIAHKWDTGWDFGTFKKRKDSAPEDAVPSYWVRYASVGQLYTHELQRGSYLPTASTKCGSSWRRLAHEP